MHLPFLFFDKCLHFLDPSPSLVDIRHHLLHSVPQLQVQRLHFHSTPSGRTFCACPVSYWNTLKANTQTGAITVLVFLVLLLLDHWLRCLGAVGALLTEQGAGVGPEVRGVGATGTTAQELLALDRERRGFQ